MGQKTSKVADQDTENDKEEEEKKDEEKKEEPKVGFFQLVIKNISALPSGEPISIILQFSFKNKENYG